jgi:hypothetical protein
MDVMTRRLAFLFLISLGLAHPASAAILPAVDVPAMVNGADVIVVGSVEADDVRSPPSRHFTRVHVLRVIKGSAPPHRISIRIDPFHPAIPAAAGQYRIFFVRGAGPTYGPVDLFHPSLPATAAGGGTAGNALIEVAEELTRVFAASPAALIDKVVAVEALSTISYEFAGPAVRTVAESRQLPARLWAISALLTMRGSEQAEAVKIDYLNSVKSVLLNPSAEDSDAAYFLIDKMEGHLKSPKAIPLLSELLRSDQNSVRRIAASLLGDIATPESSAVLAKSALDDADQDVRYYAVLGLAVANGDAKPPMDAFKKNEAAYVRRWKSWANANLRE